MLKKTGRICLALVVLLCLALLSPNARAEETAGSCGFGVNWNFDESTGTLTLSGDGDHPGALREYAAEPVI